METSAGATGERNQRKGFDVTREQSPDLSMLWRALVEARADVGRARGERATPGWSAVTAEQRLLLAALESYAAALTQHGHPVPHRLHSELAMYRTMFDIRRGRPGHR